jgi:hypothetical protein
MKVVRLSTLRTGHLYPPGNIPGTRFCQRLGRPQGQSAAERIISTKNCKDTIGKGTRDLPAFSAVFPPPPLSQSLFFPKYGRPCLLRCLVTHPPVNSLKDRNAVIFTITQTSLSRDPEDSKATILQNDGYLPNKSV